MDVRVEVGRILPKPQGDASHPAPWRRGQENPRICVAVTELVFLLCADVDSQHGGVAMEGSHK